MCQSPPDFPTNISINRQNYANWSNMVTAQQLWTCAPKTPEDIVSICNWAAAQSPVWAVRPTGVKHGWSPLTIGDETLPTEPVLLVDLTQHMNTFKFIAPAGDAPAMVTAQCGAKMYNLLLFLQFQQGGKGAAMGYAFPHVPAPGNLTLGGVLAINGHGTALPAPTEDLPSSYGSMSNHILEFTAVVSSAAAPGTYALRTFKRGDPEAAALLVHAGRAFIVSATLQVIDNYNLRCQSTMDISSDTLFAAPTGAKPPAKSLASFLEASGRVEAIWYPFTDDPWLKVWTVSDVQPAGSRLVHDPYNYAFSDNLPPELTGLLKSITKGSPQLTPTFEKGFAAFTKLMLGGGIFGGSLEDLWGPSMNTLLYVKDETLHVTANGYAIQMKRAQVQQSIHDFTQKFSAMLKAYAAKGIYPVNAPLEIRVTGLDDPSKIYHTPGQAAPASPLLSSLSYDAVAEANGYDCAVWFDVLTLPGTPGADDFYTELEAWFATHFTVPEYRLLPEWSKGWAYTSKGGWTSEAFLASVRQTLTEGRPADQQWNAAVSTLRTCDGANLFSAPLLERLFVPT
jgi:hypothetical protein